MMNLRGSKLGAHFFFFGLPMLETIHALINFAQKKDALVYKIMLQKEWKNEVGV